MPPAPIQDENRFICFRVEGKEYSLKDIIDSMLGTMITFTNEEEL